MPRIEITEQDLTTPGALAEDFDVVYVPGLVNTELKSLHGKDKDGKDFYKGIKVNEPTLFTSVAAFEELCGSEPMVFDTAQDYRSLGDYSAGFGPLAIPYHNTMFSKDAVDPGYVMAKELLGAGLNVLFERINPDIRFVEAGVNPSDFATNVSKYYKKTPTTSFKDDDMQKITASKGVMLEDEVDFKIPLNGINSVEEARAYLNTLWYSDKNTGIISAISIGNEESVEVYIKFDDKGVPGWVTTEVTNTDGTKSAVFVILNTYNCDALYEKHNNYYSKKNKDTYELLNKETEDFKVNYYNNYYEVKESSLNVYVSATDNDADVMLYTKQYQHVQLSEIYGFLNEIYSTDSKDGLVDLGHYNIKYLTSGGYPVFEYNSGSLVDKMVTLAAKRGDCVALIDHTDNQYREQNVNQGNSVYSQLKNNPITDGEFAAMFTPWASYNRITTDKKINTESGAIEAIKYTDPQRMPASFAYLKSLADSIKTNAPWLAIAGVTRGLVRNLANGGMTNIIPNGAADEMQPREGIAINAITNINPYGYTIWGNRTLKNNAENLTASSFLNIRNLVSDVKKVCYRTARKLTFEQNNDILWVNFKSSIAPTLDRMVSGYGISGYKFVRDYEHEKASEKATICAKIYLYPVYAVEDFYISIVLKDDEVSVQVAE